MCYVIWWVLLVGTCITSLVSFFPLNESCYERERVVQLEACAYPFWVKVFTCKFKVCPLQPHHIITASILQKACSSSCWSNNGTLPLKYLNNGKYGYKAWFWCISPVGIAHNAKNNDKPARSSTCGGSLKCWLFTWSGSPTADQWSTNWKPLSTSPFMTWT